ncbi:MAG: hypothetical protein CVV44_03445 [Spirochaetae bacterium HGW-Spirochaetae-1]|jgi:ankyrin repeat protein|nr:MAG: hypothetical protein CVV44_03445 [Spirochaetae bacterium HGW-Spirochaetae-1]
MRNKAGVRAAKSLGAILVLLWTAPLYAAGQTEIRDIFMAAANGAVPEIKICIENGANPVDADSRGKTPADVARENGHEEVAAFIDSLRVMRYPSGSVYVGQMKGHREHGWGVYRCFNGSRYSGDFREGKFEGLGYWTYSRGGRYAGEFRDNGFYGKNVNFHDSDVFSRDRYGETLLYSAAKRGNLTQVRLLIQRGANVNEHSMRDQTPLHFAAFEGDISIVRVLLESGADINARDMDGMTALHFAAFNGKTAVARILVENGADVNAKNENGGTPLHHAAYQDSGEIAIMLLESGARPGLRDNFGKTPLEHARVLKSIMVMRALKSR